MSSGVHERGDIYMADLEPHTGSEQGGLRPVLILQVNELNRVSSTVVIVPLTTNLKRLKLPTTVLLVKGEGGLQEDSVVLVQQIRVVDKQRLQMYKGSISATTMKLIEEKIRLTLGL